MGKIGLKKKRKGCNTYKGAKRPLSKDEVRKILNLSAIKHRQFALLVLVGCCVGLRVSELVNVTKQNLQARKFTYHASKQNKNIDKIILPVFYEWFKDLGFSFASLPDKPFIGAQSRKPLTQNYVAKLLKRYCKLIGLQDEEIKNISTHSLRKFYGRNILDDLGHSLETLRKIQRLYGHSSIDVTIRYLGYEDEFDNHELSQITI